MMTYGSHGSRVKIVSHPKENSLKKAASGDSNYRREPTRLGFAACSSIWNGKNTGLEYAAAGGCSRGPSGDANRRKILPELPL